MSKPTVVTRVDLVERDDESPSLGSATEVLEVCSHWNRASLVVLKIDGVNVTVDGHALARAIKNAGNR